MIGVKGSYQDLWKAIIRPPRDVYDESDLGRNYQFIYHRS